jgi:hypothetical protein
MEDETSMGQPAMIGRLPHCRVAPLPCIARAGGIGQPLSLLLKTHPLIKKLSLYDISPVIHGVSADLSHCDSPAQVEGHQESLAAALQDADVVVMPAGVPRKPGQTRDDLFNLNAKVRLGETTATNPKHDRVPATCSSHLLLLFCSYSYVFRSLPAARRNSPRPARRLLC